MVQNWAGNVTYRGEVARPSSIGEAQSIVAGAGDLRVLGSGHSFTDIADAAILLDVSQLPEFLEIDADRRSVRVNGAMTYGRLAELLSPLRLTLSNFASLPHISIAGAVATGTHGSGDTNQNLAAAVSRVELITGTGDLVSLQRGDDDFGGAVVSLGAVGLVVGLTLDVEPAFLVAQHSYDGLTIEAVADNLETVFASGYSVSAFTRWRDGDHLLVKSRLDAEGHELEAPPESAALLAELSPAVTQRHPIIEADGENCTEQFGVPGAAADRLPHFRLDHRPSTAAEIQSEFFVARSDGAAGIRAITAIADELADALLVSEVRSIAGDEQWMSPQVGRDSIAFHFTWGPDAELAADASRRVADALGALSPRPHWAKVFDAAQFDLDQFDRRRFIDLLERLDPSGTFRNEWFRRVVDS